MPRLQLSSADLNTLVTELDLEELDCPEPLPGRSAARHRVQTAPTVERVLRTRPAVRWDALKAS